MPKSVAAAVAFSCVALCASPLGAATGSLDSAQIEKVLVAAHAAAGGAQLDKFAQVTEAGTGTQGGPPFTASSVTDLRNGYSKSTQTVGPLTSSNGYDGASWNELNGSLSIVSLPVYVRDAVSQAYLASNAMFAPARRATIASGETSTIDGKNVYVLHAMPEGGSPLDLAFDASTYDLVQVVAYTANGKDVTTNSKFESVQGVSTPMQSVDVDPAGTKTTFTATSVKYETAVDPSAFARPAYVTHGTLAAPVSIPFASDLAGAAGHLDVPVGIGGKAATLVFDSGGANFLTPDAAKRLGLATSGGVAEGGVGSGTQMGSFAKVPSVDFGGAQLRDQSFIVTGLPYVIAHPRRGITTEGLIGFEYLSNFRITFDYAKGAIDVAPFDSPAPSGGVTLPMKSDGSHAYVLATLDGITGYFLLDTGNGGGVDLNGPFVAENHLFAAGGPTYVSPGGIGGSIASTVAVAKSLDLAGVHFTNVPVALPHTTAGAFAKRGVAGNLGARILSRFRVTFDYKAQTVTFVPNAEATAPFKSDRTGLSVNQTEPAEFDVLAVVPKSPAADAGIVAGDRITAVNGTAVASGLGLGDMLPYANGSAPVALTIVHDGASKTVTLAPRDLLPPAQ